MSVCMGAQIAFMQQLMLEGLGGSTDLVFVDMDVLVVDSLAEVCALIPRCTTCCCVSGPNHHMSSLLSSSSHRANFLL